MSERKFKVVVATNISHDSNSPRALDVFSGRNLPVFSAR